MSLTKEDQEKIAAIKRQVAEQKRQEQAEQEKRERAEREWRERALAAQRKKAQHSRHFTLLDFFSSNVAWYVRVGMAALSVVSLRLIMELSVVLFSINNHLAEISEKLDKKQE